MNSRYRSPRSKAWRNALVAAINAGLDQGLFELDPGSNTWSGFRPDDPDRDRGHTFEFTVGDIPGLGHVSDAGFDELFIRTALWPTPDAARWIDVVNAGDTVGDLRASGWLERRHGQWLQFNPSSITCKRGKQHEVADILIEPNGYGDAGTFLL